MSDNPFQVAAKAALPAFYTLAGVVCTYTRAAATVSLTMLPPPAGQQIIDAQGVRGRSLGGEFTCKKADLILSGAATAPARGDTITDAAGAVWDILDWEELADTAEWRISVKGVDA